MKQSQFSMQLTVRLLCLSLYVTCEREGKWEASESLSAGRWCDVSLEKQHSGGRWGCEPCDMSPWCGTRWEEPLTQNSHTWVCGRHSRK